MCTKIQTGLVASVPYKSRLSPSLSRQQRHQSFFQDIITTLKQNSTILDLGFNSGNDCENEAIQNGSYEHVYTYTEIVG